MYRIARALGWVIALGVLGIGAALWFSKPPDCLLPSSELIETEFFEAPPCMFIDDDSLYVANLQTSEGMIEIVLDPGISPTAVNAFIFTAMHDWYDGTLFHRVLINDEHAYAQGGAANPDGTGHAGFLVQHEEPSPILRYVRGAVAGLVDGDPRKLGSQFFLVAEDWDEIGPPKAYPIYPPLGRIYDLPSLQALDRIIQRGSADGTVSQSVLINRIDIEKIQEDQSTIPYEPSTWREIDQSPEPSPSK